MGAIRKGETGLHLMIADRPPITRQRLSRQVSTYPEIAVPAIAPFD